MQKKKKVGITMILVLFITIGIFCALPKQKAQLLQNTQIAMYYTDNGNQVKTNTIPAGYILDNYTCINNNVTITWNYELTKLRIKARGAASCKVYLKYGLDESGANIPKLVDNLIPVVYNENTSKWVMSV